jgi:hypothetical protein
MNISIPFQRLLDLENAESKLIALQNGGVDNWQWFDESLTNYVEATTLPQYGIETELEYSKDTKVFYNNNPAKFVSYLSEKVAVIVVEAFPDFAASDPTGTCQGCMVGDSDNKISCSCSELYEMLEHIEESTDPTYMPLIVDVSMLHKQPIVITQHESKLKVIEDKKTKVLEITKTLTLKNIELEAREKELNGKIKALEELSAFENLSVPFNTENATEFIEEKCREMKEASNRKDIGGSFDEYFTHDGKQYTICGQVFWEKSEWYDLRLTGYGIDIKLSDEF